MAGFSMPKIDYFSLLKLDDQELKNRLRFFELKDEDFSRLKALAPLAATVTKDVVEELYELITSHSETYAFVADPDLLKRLKLTQGKYFLGLFEGRCDVDYVRERIRVGAVHERIGMPVKWYIGAYRRYMSILDRIIREHHKAEPEQGRLAMQSLSKLVMFDMTLAIDTYFAAHLDSMARHQAAIRELSTPVIKVHDRVLMLPLIGTMDTFRAQQIMEAVLLRIVEEKARVMIIDIAGVSVVDTKVADAILKTAKAIELMGAIAILTGISPSIARTMVQLGVDVSGLRTSSQLSDGIEQSLTIIGKKIIGVKEPSI